MSAKKENINQHFVIDDSGSMRAKAYGDKDLGRMRDVASAIEAVVPDCVEDDADGIDICFLNKDHPASNMTSPSEVKAHIIGVKPQGGTPIGSCLKALVKDYWDKWDAGKKDPKNFIIITDGVPDYENEVIDAILHCCYQALCRGDDPKVVTFFFLQVGHPSKLGDRDELTDYGKGRFDDYKVNFEAARAFLKTLDDGLRNKFLDLLRGKAVRERRFVEYIAEIENIDAEKPEKEKRLGRFDIVEARTLKDDGKDLDADDVRQAMYGARFKELTDK